MAFIPHRYLILAGLAMFIAIPAQAKDSKATDSLKAQITQADATFFDAFNRCDIDKMASMFSPQLEFYHDTGGVTDYEQTMEASKRLCQRVPDLTRTLEPDTVKIYPIKDFGAIQQGQHMFCHKENGKDDCGTFGFTHIWKQTEQGWIIHRVVSYGH